MDQLEANYGQQAELFNLLDVALIELKLNEHELYKLFYGIKDLHNIVESYHFEGVLFIHQVKC